MSSFVTIFSWLLVATTVHINRSHDNVRCRQHESQHSHIKSNIENSSTPRSDSQFYQLLLNLLEHIPVDPRSLRMIAIDERMPQEHADIARSHDVTVLDEVTSLAFEHTIALATTVGEGRRVHSVNSK